MVICIGAGVATEFAPADRDLSHESTATCNNTLTTKATVIDVGNRRFTLAQRVPPGVFLVVAPARGLVEWRGLCSERTEAPHDLCHSICGLVDDVSCV
jgi:hypothetical protein